MAEQFGVSVDELRRVSGDLHDASSAMKEVMSSLHAQLAAAGPAWGGGEMGHQFAEGPNGYLAQLEWVDGSVTAKTGLLDYFSDLLKQLANSFEESDNPGAAAPVADNGTGPPGGGSTPNSGNATTGSAPTGANPGVRSGDVPAGQASATNAVGPPANEVGSPANGAASPTGAGSPGGGGSGRGGGAPQGGGEPQAPSSQGRTPSQSDPAGKGPGAGEATSGAPVSGDSPGDRVTSGVEPEDDASMRSGTSTPDEMLNSSMASPNAGPSPDGTGPASPNPPALPKPPTPPNQSKPRRAGAPDEPAPPSPKKDGRSRRPSGAPQADPGKEHTGSEPVRSVTGRAGVADDAKSIRGDGVARARRRTPDRSRRSDATGDPSAEADAVGLGVGDLDRESDDDAGSHPGEERGLREDSLREDEPHRDR